MKENRKSKKGILLIIFLLAIASAGGYYYRTQTKSEMEPVTNYKQELVRRGNISAGLSESGTVNFGTIDQSFHVEEPSETSNNSDSGGNGSGSEKEQKTELLVEEVYVSPGQYVNKGDKILKVQQESIDCYMEKLQAARKTAELTVLKEEINVESKQAKADYTHEIYLAEGEIAEETYQATIISLENEITELEQDLAEKESEIEELELEESWGIDVSESLATAKESYHAIEANLKIAQNNKTTKSIAAKQTYENAMTNYRYADQLYDIDTDGISQELDAAKEELKRFDEAIVKIESQLTEGYIYADYSGTVTAMDYVAGDYLNNDAVIISYTNEDDVVMSVAVSQNDIGSISIGMDVDIYLTAYKEVRFTGKIDSIAASASTGSSTVNYDVSVRFSGDTDKIYSGMTGEVWFDQKTVSDILYIPNTAIWVEESQPYVKVLTNEGQVEKRLVTTGFSNGSLVEIPIGLDEGETVLIESRVIQ